MNELLSNYLPIVLFVGLAAVIGIVLLLSSFLVAVKQPDPEKVSAFEAGFDAFDDARMKFDIRFYLVSILFIIFDLEVAWLFPWAVAFRDVGWFGFWSVMIFLGVLTIGFIYEWRKGAPEMDEAKAKRLQPGLRQVSTSSPRRRWRRPSFYDAAPCTVPSQSTRVFATTVSQLVTWARTGSLMWM